MHAFRTAVESKDLVALEACLAEDVRFCSPAVHTPYDGKPATMLILRAVFEVFEDFRYTSVVTQGDESVLRFEARVGDRQIEGADFVRTEGDYVTELTVMVRPLRGLEAVVAAMGPTIERLITS